MEFGEEVVGCLFEEVSRIFGLNRVCFFPFLLGATNRALESRLFRIDKVFMKLETLTRISPALDRYHHMVTLFLRGQFFEKGGELSIYANLITPSNLLTVSLWKHFASAYGQGNLWPDSSAPNSYQTPIIPPAMLHELIPAALRSPRGRLLTSLALRNVELSRAQWISICNLDNLAILQVYGSSHYTFDSQVARAWGDRAKDGAFQCLRVLEMDNEDDGCPFELLVSLSNIKSLQVILWSGRNITTSSVVAVEKYGWKQLCEHPNEDQ